MPDAAVAAVRSWWSGARRIERVCCLVAAVLVLSGLVHLGVGLVDDRPWTGPVSWRKPATFGVSFGLTLAAVAWLGSYLRIGARARAVLLGVFATDCVLEVAGITVQAWRDVPSHFDMATPVNRAIAMLLAVGGGVLVAVLVSLAVAAFRAEPAAPPSMRLALRAGFGYLLVGLASGAAMIARGVTLVNTGHQQLAYQLGGFLKPVHAVGLHGVLVLPLLAALLALTAWPESRRRRVVALAVAGYALLTVAALIVSLAT